MNIPLEIRKNFAVKVFSCKADTLRKEQVFKKRKLIENLKSQKNEMISGDLNQVHPAWLRTKKIETMCYNFLKTALYANHNHSSIII